MDAKQSLKILIEEKLTDDPQTSNRAIASELNTNDRLVGRVREELEANQLIPIVTHIRGLDGRLRPRKRVQRKEPQREPSNILPFTESRYRRKRVTNQANKDSVLSQIRSAFTGHPLAFIVALPFGGFVPLAVWCLAHLEPLMWWHWSMIAGGALFSSLTVITWGQTILSNSPKAIGFAILVEGVMLASKTQWLSISALTLLVVINATSCAVALAQEEST
jgi:hypothetical protein